MSDGAATASQDARRHLDRAIAAAFDLRAEINRLHQGWIDAVAREPGGLAAALGDGAGELRPGARVTASLGPFERTYLWPEVVTHAGHPRGEG